jgi:hypothetical protein
MDSLTHKIEHFYLQALGLGLPAPEPSPLDEQFGWHSPIGWTAPAETPDPEPSPADTGERLTFRQVLLREVERFQGWDNEVGDFLAGELAVIADRARFLSADSPAEYRDHAAILDGDPEPN